MINSAHDQNKLCRVSHISCPYVSNTADRAIILGHPVLRNSFLSLGSRRTVVRPVSPAGPKREGNQYAKCFAELMPFRPDKIISSGSFAMVCHFPFLKKWQNDTLQPSSPWANVDNFSTGCSLNIVFFP